MRAALQLGSVPYTMMEVPCRICDAQGTGKAIQLEIEGKWQSVETRTIPGISYPCRSVIYKKKVVPVSLDMSGEEYVAMGEKS